MPLSLDAHVILELRKFGSVRLLRVSCCIKACMLRAPLRLLQALARCSRNSRNGPLTWSQRPPRCKACLFHLNGMGPALPPTCTLPLGAWAWVLIIMPVRLGPTSKGLPTYSMYIEIEIEISSTSRFVWISRIYMGLYGFMWVYIHLYGFNRFCMDLHWFIWIYMDLCWFICILICLDAFLMCLWAWCGLQACRRLFFPG